MGHSPPLEATMKIICPKCDHNEIKVIYWPEVIKGSRKLLCPVPAPESIPENLHCTCCRCNFDWDKDCVKKQNDSVGMLINTWHTVDQIEKEDWDGYVIRSAKNLMSACVTEGFEDLFEIDVVIKIRKI